TSSPAPGSSGRAAAPTSASPPPSRSSRGARPAPEEEEETMQKLIRRHWAPFGVALALALAVPADAAGKKAKPTPPPPAPVATPAPAVEHGDVSLYLATGAKAADRSPARQHPLLAAAVVPVDWSVVQPAPDRFDWSSVDHQVEA